jgi:uncharacterized protein YceH (UPF0502 family)
MTSDQNNLPDPLLEPHEARVLACIIEKEATTPEQYPLTANAVQVACNQKTAREPVMDLDAGTVGHALRTLEGKRLVRSIHGARAQRYDHRTDDVYAISPEQRALLALLMLRGAQTAGELFTRSERLFRYRDLEQVRTILERLETRHPALVVKLPRGAGQREDRYAHLLCGADAAAAQAAESARSSARMSTHGTVDTELGERVVRLETEVAELRAQLQRLAEQLTPTTDET